MVSMQTDSPIQTNILPTQNIGQLDQNQAQVYSIETNTNNFSSAKKPRRNRPIKLNDCNPVTINPQITRSSPSINFAIPNHHPRILPESKSSFLSTHLIDDPRLQLRFYLGDSYGADNNNNYHQISSCSMTLDSSSSTPIQQTSTWPNDCLPKIDRNSIPRLVTQSYLFGINRFLDNNTGERSISVPSIQQTQCIHRYPSLTSADQRILLDHSHPLPIPLSSILKSTIPSIKSKQNYSGTTNPSASIEQHQQSISQGPINSMPSTTLNGLPCLIPSSVNTTLSGFEESSSPINMATTPNVVPLMRPVLIGSTKSLSTDISNDVALMPIPQNVPLRDALHISHANPTTKQYLHEKGYFHSQASSSYPSPNYLPHHLQCLSLVTNPSQYCAISPNKISIETRSMACPSILPDISAATRSFQTPTEIKQEKKKREKIVEKPDVALTLDIELPADGKTSADKPLTIGMSETKTRKHIKSHPKDIRTKKELRRITQRNRLAVLKFMMRKRKQQKQERLLITKYPNAQAETTASQLVTADITRSQKMEDGLPDIIAPSLRIFLDTSQKVESISLYYHRRRRPDVTQKSPSTSSTSADNKLGLLIQAVEFIETLHKSSNLAASPMK